MTYSKDIRTPDFTTVEELEAELHKIPKAVGAPIMSPRTPEKLFSVLERLKGEHSLPSDKELAEAFMDLVHVKGRKNVHVEGKPEQSYYIPTDQYRIVTHEEAFGSTLIAALRNTELSFEGTFIRGLSTKGNQLPGARVSVMVWFNDRRLEVRTGRGGETIRVGLVFENSMDGSRALTVRVIAMNLLCKNGMIGESKLEGITVSRRHVGNSETQLVQAIQVEKFITEAVAWAERVTERLRAATKKIVRTEDVIDILYGIDLPKTQIDKMLPIDQLLVGDQKQDANSMRGIYDAVTNYYSNRHEGSADRIEEMLVKAERLLDVDPQVLMDLGQERRQKGEDAENAGTDVDPETVERANAKAIALLQDAKSKDKAQT